MDSWGDCPRCQRLGIRVKVADSPLIYCADCGLRENTETGELLAPWAPARRRGRFFLRYGVPILIFVGWVGAILSVEFIR